MWQHGQVKVQDLLSMPAQPHMRVLLGSQHPACAGAGKFFWYLLIIYLTLDLMSFYGIMGVYITPDLRFASTLSGFFYGLWCGNPKP